MHIISILCIISKCKKINWWIKPACIEISYLYEELITDMLHISQCYFGIDGV